MNNKVLKSLAAVGVVMVAYDAMASAVSRVARLEYSYFMFGSLLLCGLIGFFVSWRTSFVWGIVAGFVAGLAESTLGWAVSTWIGPTTKVVPESITTDLILFTIFVVMMSSGFFAAVGSGIAALIKAVSNKT
jgi:hypothetical protein